MPYVNVPSTPRNTKCDICGINLPFGNGVFETNKNCDVYCGLPDYMEYINYVHTKAVPEKFEDNLMFDCFKYSQSSIYLRN